MSKIKKGLYQHYKGQFYRVLDIAMHSETEEHLVIYQALYGQKGTWVRPLSMFLECVSVDGEKRPRFEYYHDQTIVLEVAILDVKLGQQKEFELTFKQAQTIISSMHGYVYHELQKCIEKDNRYILLVHWQSLEDHIVGFRQSKEYQHWQNLLHDFYEPFPEVLHFQGCEQLELT